MNNLRQCASVHKILERLHGVKKSGSGWIARCPGHDDKTASLSISEGRDGRTLIHCHAGCTLDQICAGAGIEPKDLFPENGRRLASARAEIVATYDYTDASGKLIFQAVRKFPKDFRQRQPDGSGGWTWNLRGIPKPYPLYRLPDLINPDRPADETVFVVAGEKDVNRLIDSDLLSTTNPLGEGKWKFVDQEPLRGRYAVIIPDNDIPGRKHAEDVARRLQGVAEVVKVLELPDLPKKGDVSDWFNKGGTADQLLGLAEKAPAWTPAGGVSIRHQDQGSQQVTGDNGRPNIPGTGFREKDRQILPWRDFPSIVSPSPVWQYVDEAAIAMDVDRSMIGVPLLAGLASAIGTTRRLQLTPGRRGWYVYPIIWAGVVSESGTKKSPALDIAMESLRRIDDRLENESELELEQYERDKIIYDASLAEWKKAGRKLSGVTFSPGRSGSCDQIISGGNDMKSLD